MARNVEDCEKAMEIMVEGISYDIFTPPMKWARVNEMPKKIGFLKQFDFLPVSKANQRAIDISLDILRKRNIEIVEIDINDIVEDILINTNAQFL